MSDVSLAHDLLVWIPQHRPSGRAVPLQLQFGDDKLTLTVSPGADTRGPDAGRAAVALCHYFDQHQILHRVTSQGLDSMGRETVIIPLPRRG
jgi:hypothetical protein